MEPTSHAALAAHFRTKRRISSAPGGETDARVKQAQNELTHAADDHEKVVFRFDFNLGERELAVDGATKKKRKNKKKNKKKETIPSYSNGVITKGEDAQARLEVVPVEATQAKEDEADGAVAGSKKTASKKKKKKTKSKASVQPDDIETVKPAVPTPFIVPVPAASTVPVTKDLPPPPGFFKLRKPTSSDSEVMKMQLRYGRGKRNAAAIALREKQKQTVTVPSSTSSASDASGFQFNFY